MAIEYRLDERCTHHWAADPAADADGYVHHWLRVTYRQDHPRVAGCPSFRVVDETVVSHRDTGIYAQCGNSRPVFDTAAEARQDMLQSCWVTR